MQHHVQNNMLNNPRKSYKRLRLKWFAFFIVLAGVIIWTGTYAKKKVSPEDQEQPEDQQYGLEQPVERNDFQYLEESPDIRVILQAGNYSGLYHDRAEISFPEGGYILTYVSGKWEKDLVEKGETVTIGIGDSFDYSISQHMTVAAVGGDEKSPLILKSIERNRSQCSYYGRLEITLEDAGLMVINTLPLENYLYSVVPSEMPASYEQEALRAQAILARTYAYKYLIEPAYPQFGAHVDDSITFQVYGNIDMGAAASQAVLDTAGVLLFYGKSLAEVYYYSTSCGYGTDGTAWGGSGQKYLQAARIGPGTLKSADGTLTGKEAEQYYVQQLQKEQIFRNMITMPFANGYEAEESWYRWSAENITADTEVLVKRMKERYQANPNVILTKSSKGEFVSKPIKSLGDIVAIKVTERGAGGVCKSLVIEGSKNTYKILLEYNIRYVLNGAGIRVKRADGTESYCSMLLPSGFFYLDTVHFGQNVISYNIYGGGYGHGVGMSQNGANQMAEDGMSCQEILQYFFPETILVSYERDN